MIPESNEVRFEVTTKCNYNCIICPREKLTRKPETMSYNTFQFLLDKLINESSQFNTIAFPGMGEPLLDESFDEKIIYAKRNGFAVLILTNGSLLTVERFKKLEGMGVDSIRVSMYGDTPESYNLVHGVKNSGFFERVKDNITKISEIKKQTRLLLTYNIVKNANDSSIESWIEYWKDRSDLLEVWNPHNWVNGRGYRYVQKEKLKTCGRPFNTPLQVQVDGTVNMCCFDYNGELLLGDLKKQSLREIFDSEAYKKILKHHTSGDFNGSGLICENCDQRNVDKSDVMVYNSKFDIRERVNKVSTTYAKIL